MGKETVDVLIEGGKATAAPPLGPALGPLKVNIGQVVADINAKTQDFKGMKVPVKVIVDTDTKEYSIKIGTPPASQLVKSELNIKKGSGTPNSAYVGDMSIEQIKKVARMKMDSLLANTQSAAVREIAGTCYSLGITIDGKKPRDFIADVKAGKYVNELSEDIE
ncbi:MAG: 50S ribosomal protein L11 [Nanoarchaeota archaeon]|nr:50S ribosomal protein L11 [Nanoarchaeota archaeon]